MNKDRFLEKYEAQARVSDRRYAYRVPMSFDQYHRRYSAMDVYDYESQIRHQQYIEMLIPQHKLEELINTDYYYEQMKQHVDYASVVIERQTKEKQIRDNNPALQKAWDNYQLLLKLCQT